MRDFHGLLINSRDNLALTAVVAELAQVDALPCAEIERRPLVIGMVMLTPKSEHLACAGMSSAPSMV